MYQQYIVLQFQYFGYKFRILHHALNTFNEILANVIVMLSNIANPEKNNNLINPDCTTKKPLSRNETESK